MIKALIQKIKENPMLIKAFLLSFLPLVSISILCGMHGKTIFDVSLLTSGWNDELFYYKLTESILHHGIPQGFFGYSESTAQLLSFATWNPLILIPYVIWGLLFGWNLSSPILCNLFLSMLSIFLFVCFTKPSNRQCVSLAILYLPTLFSTRYILSGMAETIIIFWFILYLGLFLRYEEEKRTGDLITMFLLVGILTLLRPYFLVFILMPAFWAIKRWSWPAAIVSFFIMCSYVVLYFTIDKYFCADFFIDFTENIYLLEYSFDEAGAAIKETVQILWDNGLNFLKGFKHDIRHRGTVGQFAVVVAMFVLETVVCLLKKKKTEAYRNGYWGFSYLLILAAFFLLYQLEAGSRHLVVLITAGVFLLSKMEDKYFVKTVLISLSLLFFFVCWPSEDWQKRVPFADSNVEKEFEEWEAIMDAKIHINETDTPNWDNVLIWAMSDLVGPEEEHLITQWQLLYAVPDGVGISCCRLGWIEKNFDKIKSRYLVVVPGGTIDEMCANNGKWEIARTESLVLYRLR